MPYNMGSQAKEQGRSVPPASITRYSQAAAEELSANGFRTVMDIDTLGTFTASRAAFPALRSAGGGTVINISATLHYGATWWQVQLQRPAGPRTVVAEAWCSSHAMGPVSSAGRYASQSHFDRS